MSKHTNAMGTLNALLAQVQQNKAAEALNEPGSIGGETSHPIKGVDDNSEKAQEGARSSENTSDVKEDQGPMGVESAPTSAGETQESTNASAVFGPLDTKSTGKDPATETSSVKGTKEDGSIGGKTDHPATTEDGEKFGSALEALTAYSKKAEVIGQRLLASVIKSASPDSAKPAAPVATPTSTAKTAAQVAADTKAAAEAGYDLAGIFAGFEMPAQDKVAMDQLVLSQIKSATDEGLAQAEALYEFYQGFFARKQAEEEGGRPAEEGKEEPQEHESHENPGQESAEHGQGGGPPTGDAGMPGEEELLAMLTGGGGAPGGSAGGSDGAPPMGGGGGGGGGGADLASLLASAGGGSHPGGGDPSGGSMPGAGGPPGGAPGGGGGMPGAGGAPGGSPEDAAMLMQVLQELGIDPNQLQQKAAAKLASGQKQSQIQAVKKARMKSMVLDLVGSPG